MKKNKLIYLYSICIILLPFLYQYSSPISFLSLGDFLIAIFTVISLLYLIFKRGKINFFIPIMLLAILLVFLTILTSFGSPFYIFFDSFTLFLKIVLYCLVIFVSINIFDFSLVKRIYIKLCIVFCIYLIIQVVYTKITNKYLPICINNDWLFSWEKKPKDLAYYYSMYGSFRPSSLFVEPGYFALYVIPCLIICLISPKIEDHNMKISLLISFSLILSTSGAGIGIGFIIWGLFLVTKIAYIKNKKIYILPIAFFLILTFGISIFIFLLFKTNIFERVFGGSFYARIVRGFLIYDTLDFKYKILGVGLNNVANYLNFYCISTPYDEANLNLGSTFSTYLNQFGILGSFALIMFMIYLVYISRKNYVSFVLCLYFIIYIVFEDVLFNFRMGFMLSIMLYYTKYSKHNVYTENIGDLYEYRN